MPTGAHKCRKVAPRSIQHRVIVWNSDVLTTAARLCTYLDHSYVTATIEATQVYNYYCSDCPIWSTTERSEFLFRTMLFSVVGCFLAPCLWAPGAQNSLKRKQWGVSKPFLLCTRTMGKSAPSLPSLGESDSLIITTKWLPSIRLEYCSPPFA